MRGAAMINEYNEVISENFYSRASCEARRGNRQAERGTRRFLLTRLMRGAAECETEEDTEPIISTHAPHARRGETSFEVMTGSAEISTHAPHARRGLGIYHLTSAFCHFYSRASCEARLY